jgi:mRNA interferase RelE/StbE
VTYEARLSDRAAKDLDRLDRKTLQRMLIRLDQIAEAPYEPRFSSALTHQAGLRKSRVGGWRIIFTVSEENRTINVATIERRGQVYRRI